MNEKLDETRRRALDRIDRAEKLYLHGLTLSEVADVLSLSQGTVKSRLAYGLASLRRSFNEG